MSEETLPHEQGSAVRDHAIALHFSEPQATVTGSTLDGLAGQDLDRPSRPGVDLVVHHVLQALVVGWSNENLGLQLAARVPVVQHLVPAQLVAAFVQRVGDGLHRDVREGGGIALVACDGRHLAQQTLDQMAERHAGGDSVGVDNDVGHHALHREWHVLLAVCDTARALLPVPAAELVADLGDAHRPHANLHKLESLRIGAQHDLVDDARLAGPQHHGAVPLGVSLLLLPQVVVVLVEGGCFAHDDVIPRHASARRDQAVVLQLVVRAVPHAVARVARGLLKLLIRHLVVALLLLAVRAVEHGPEKAAVDGGLVHDDGVFLVVSGVAADARHGVLPGWQLAEVEVLHRARRDQRLLRVEQQVRKRVHAQLVIGDVHAHGLLAHRTLIGVTRTLVVVRERNDTATDAENHTGMNLTVRVRGAVHLGALLLHLARVRQIADGHADHHGLLLFSVHKLHQTLFE
mmetsp:Transcript_10450/g.26294  ORF Transcript_10450/g.26294 Transcript_10450/m.26294 type:complete len:461 (-) Transcript_10450:2197-3579(-)